MVVAEAIINSEAYENKLDSARKINAFICQHCSMSKDDLPANLRMKFEAFSLGNEKGTEGDEKTKRLI